MSVDIKSKAIKMAADLLRRRPSTDKDDFPNVPNYYFHHVDHYVELGRRAAIMLRDMVYTIHLQQAALDALKWRPIEAAPKDGSVFMAITDYGMHCNLRWNGECFVHEPTGFGHITHWMPLPKLPEANPKSARQFDVLLADEVVQSPSQSGFNTADFTTENGEIFHLKTMCREVFNCIDRAMEKLDGKHFEGDPEYARGIKDAKRIFLHELR